jgi:adenosine deaminase
MPHPEASASKLHSETPAATLDPAAAAAALDPVLDAATLDVVRRMPKAELHLHVDGSLRPGTALELARTRDVDAPRDLSGMRAALAAPLPCRDQLELLRAFDLPTALLQDADAIERAARELVEDVATDGTRYVELRWAPSLHTLRGLSLEAGIAALVAGAGAGAAATGMVVRLIAVILRTLPVEEAEAMTRAAVRFTADGLVGLDCAGREAEAPDPRRFRRAYAIAREAGLGLTCHAAEWGGAPQVWQALELGPGRIAHGAAAAADPDLVAELTRRDVALDLCPTSNWQAGLVPRLADHPLARLHRAGAPVTLSTDDRTVSDLTLVREYARAIGVLGLTLEELWSIDRGGLRAAFLHREEPVRQRLLAGFDAWAAAEPRLERVATRSR